MYPLLFSIGPFRLYSFSVFFVLSWCLFSFLFWRNLRHNGVDEDKIFDITFYATIAGFIVSRIAFVFFHLELFADTWLKTIAIWVQPGLSLYGALFGFLLTLVSVSRSNKVRLSLALDAFAFSFPPAMFIGLIGVFLDGSIVGKITQLPWALRVIGQVGYRHPIALYEMLFILCIIVLLSWSSGRSSVKKYPYGTIGVWMFMLYSFGMFLLEFIQESHVYWVSLSVNQWALIAIFAESLGAFYVRGGGREKLRPIINKLYAKFSKRHS